MFRLEDSANITASPQPFGEPSSRRRPLSETEFPRSETSPASPQAIPPLPPRTPASPLPPPRPTVFPPLPPLLPPRPTAFPHPFPGVSGPRRQSTRQNTYDSYAPEGSAPGGGVGGFRRLLPFNLRSYSNPPQYESGDITGGVHAGVWPIYNEKSQKYDDEMSKKWISELDNLLIFSALFSAIVTAFLIRALDDLGPNYQQQSAILLYQILNGRDPNLENIPNPAAPFRPSSSSIVVNCLWFASLSASLGASFGAIACKGWLPEYYEGANPVVGLIRACRRQIRFMEFQRWNVPTLIALLSPLLHLSVLLFFAGAVVYLWKMDERVAIVYQIMGGLFASLYLLPIFLPFVISVPFRPYLTLVFHRLSIAVVKAVIPIVDGFVRGCYPALRYLAGTALALFAQTVSVNQTLQHWYIQARTIFPTEYKDLRVRWEDAFDDDSLGNIDIGQRVQEEAILWLAQMPLDQSESKPVVSSLALISSSRPYIFPQNVIVSLILTLESSLREKPSQERTDTATDCILVLGRIKFQSVVDRNSDRDHDVGGVPVTSLVAWAAQKFTADAFRVEASTPHSRGIQARLLTAAAWLSPVEAEGVEWNGEKLEIQDRSRFIEEIRTTIEWHVRSNRPLDKEVFVDLIHGMHACIPRGDYGTASPIVSLLPLIYENYYDPWSEDEVVLRALINYALDLLLPPSRRVPLVEREIEFEKLALGLIDALMIIPTFIEAVVFGFWLVYRVPYAFKSRKTLLTDIGYIWTSANEVIPEDHRGLMSHRAVEAFVAVAQLYVVATDKPPKFITQSALTLVGAALEHKYSRPMGTYAMAMLLNFGTSRQVHTFTDWVPAERFKESLFGVRGDLEKGLVEEGVLDLQIYSTFILSKYPPAEPDVGRVKALIGEMDKTIGDTAIGDPGVETSPDLDRVRWKAIYLSALLFTLVPEDEKGDLLEGLEAKVRALLRNGGLPLVTDYKHCLQRLDMGALELRTPTEQRGPVYKAFEGWTDGFPLFPLVGSVTAPARVR